MGGVEGTEHADFGEGGTCGSGLEGGGLGGGRSYFANTVGREGEELALAPAEDEVRGGERGIGDGDPMIVREQLALH